MALKGEFRFECVGNKRMFEHLKFSLSPNMQCISQICRNTTIISNILITYLMMVIPLMLSFFFLNVGVLLVVIDLHIFFCLDHWLLHVSKNRNLWINTGLY